MTASPRPAILKGRPLIDLFSGRLMTESSFADHQRDAADVGGLGFAVLTFSDTRSEETDASGRAISEMIDAAGHRVACYALLKDDADAIRRKLTALLSEEQVAVIVTSGGTGISARDSAYEVVSSLLQKRLDGFGELFRSLSYAEIGSPAMLSRAVGGIAEGKVLFALPGSTNAVRLGMQKLILPQAAHLYHELHK